MDVSKINYQNQFHLIKTFFKQIKPKRKKNLYFLLFLMIFSGFTESLTVAVVVPFLNLLTNPDIITKNNQINFFLNFFNLKENDLFLILTLLLIIFAFLSAFSKFMNQWLNKKWAAELGSDLSLDIYRQTIYQPYLKHLNFNSSEILAIVTGDVNDLINNVVNPFLTLISSALISISLIFTLFLVSWKVAAFSGLIIFVCYSVSVNFASLRLLKLGEKKINLRRNVIKNIQEGMGGIRDVILDNNQEFYLKLHSEYERPLRNVQAKIALYSIFPKSIIEPTALSLIALIGFFTAQGGDAGIIRTFPLLGALALGAQRLIPAIQYSYQSWAALKGSKAILSHVLKELIKDLPVDVTFGNSRAIKLSKNIKFENISFRYNENSPFILKNFNLEISKGEKIGFIGKTGSGKSTFINLFMGLISPCFGKILIDKKNLYDPNRPLLMGSWRASIAHVSQDIFLSNGSIAENIAFGIPREKINMKKVKSVAIQAKISEFIESCTNKYDTQIGERGVRLSGGQKQRIALARALYKDVSILVLDEATSALDNNTEKEIIKTIDQLNDQITVIMIAHRLSTLVNCDRIIELKKGKINKEGTPKEILNL